jgi:hypothetical protein
MPAGSTGITSFAEMMSNGIRNASTKTHRMEAKVSEPVRIEFGTHRAPRGVRQGRRGA